ncbi:hypothetical protein [Cryobacterium sp. BB307]|uniref:hypothetical protein n=1 Tax=Cryobacterium sp. BB307 TaxID=2716317 RepID=UPI001446DB19|nr:hypothetical protein [Cryobacterium sp. BB307]
MRARSAASVALASLVLAGTTACTFLTPQATLEPYDPSDGFGATIGNLEVRNAIIVSEDGQTGNLVVVLANGTDRSMDVKLQWENADGDKVDQRVHLNADSIKNLGEDQQVVLTDIDTQPGALFPVFIQYGSETGKQLNVPVLDGTLPEYQGLLPEAPEAE